MNRKERRSAARHGHDSHEHLTAQHILASLDEATRAGRTILPYLTDDRSKERPLVEAVVKANAAWHDYIVAALARSGLELPGSGHPH